MLFWPFLTSIKLHPLKKERRMTRLSSPICAPGAHMSNVFPRNIASPPPIAVAGQGWYVYEEQGKKNVDGSGGAAG